MSALWNRCLCSRKSFGEEELIIAIDNKTNADELTKCFVLEFDEDLPDKLLKRPLMFYIYDDLPILKLYRSV